MHKNSSSVKKNSIRREGICLSISTCTNICSDERKWEKGGGGEKLTRSFCIQTVLIYMVYVYKITKTIYNCTNARRHEIYVHVINKNCKQKNNFCLVIPCADGNKLIIIINWHSFLQVINIR